MTEKYLPIILILTLLPPENLLNTAAEGISLKHKLDSALKSQWFFILLRVKVNILTKI